MSCMWVRPIDAAHNKITRMNTWNYENISANRYFCHSHSHNYYWWFDNLPIYFFHLKWNADTFLAADSSWKKNSRSSSWSVQSVRNGLESIFIVLCFEFFFSLLSNLCIVLQISYDIELSIVYYYSYWSTVDVDCFVSYLTPMDL